MFWFSAFEMRPSSLGSLPALIMASISLDFLSMRDPDDSPIYQANNRSLLSIVLHGNGTFDSGSWFLSQLAVYLCSRWTWWQWFPWFPRAKSLWFPRAKSLSCWWVLVWSRNFLVYQTNSLFQSLQESWDFGGWKLCSLQRVLMFCLIHWFFKPLVLV